FATTHTQLVGTTKVDRVSASSPAKAAGLRAGDRIVAIDGKRTPSFDAISKTIQGSNGNEIAVTVSRDGQLGRLKPVHTGQASDGRWILGFAPGTRETQVDYTVAESARNAARWCWETVTGTGKAIAGIFHQEQRKQLSGPVGIVRASEQALQEGFSYYLQLL